MIPCCLSIIAKEEHDQILNGSQQNGPLLGGAVGKHQQCPNDAEHAHRLLSGTFKEYQTHYYQ